MKKRAFLLSPIFAALIFTGFESWDLMHEPDSPYIPVVFEILLFVVSYIPTAIVNALLIVPLTLLIQRKSKNSLLGIVWALFVALFITTVAYAYEIFGYEDSILHPKYLYTLFIPVFLTSAATFFFLRAAPETKVPEREERAEREEREEREERAERLEAESEAQSES